MAKHQWTNAVRVTKANDPKARNHPNAGIGTTGPLMQCIHGSKDSVGVERKARDSALQLMGEHIEQNLGIGLRINVAPVTAVHVVLQLRCIRKVSVMAKNDAKWGIHIKGLGLFSAHGTSRGGVANMPNAHLAKKITHIAGSKDIANKAVTP